MATKHYTVTTRDVDGKGTRSFATLDAAVRRFEEMAGMTTEAAIADALAHLQDAGQDLPTVAMLRSLRAVSMFGTVVVLEAVSDEAKARADAMRAADWVVMCSAPAYGSRDELIGSRGSKVEGPFLTEEEANAALARIFDDLGEDGPGELDFYVARKSQGLRRPYPTRPAVAALDDGSGDIPF